MSALHVNTRGPFSKCSAKTSDPKSTKEIMKLADEIDYQSGSIISREIVKKKGGTVTVFAFDKGQGLSEHTAPFDALVYVLDGEAEIIIDAASQVAKAGELVTMPANKPHALNALKPFKMLLIMIKSE